MQELNAVWIKRVETVRLEDFWHLDAAGTHELRRTISGSDVGGPYLPTIVISCRPKTWALRSGPPRIVHAPTSEAISCAVELKT